MGFLDKLLGRKKGPRPEPRRDAPAEPPPGRKDAMEGTSYPLTAEFRLRSPDYKRLRVDWRQLTLDSPETWSQKKTEMEEEFFRKFAFYRTQAGTQAPRWNAEVWRRVRDSLVTERR